MGTKASSLKSDSFLSLFYCGSVLVRLHFLKFTIFSLGINYYIVQLLVVLKSVFHGRI